MLIASILVSPIAAASSVNIIVNGLLQPIVTDVITKDGYTLVGLRQIAELLDADKVDWNDVKRCVTIEKDNKKVVLYVDDNTISINGDEQKLPVAVEFVNGSAMVPLRIIGEAFDAEVSWSEDTRTVEFTKDTGKYLFLTVDRPVTGESTLVLSYDEALKKAVDKSSNLKTIDDSIEYLDELRDDLGQNLRTLDEYGAVLNNMNNDSASITEWQLKINDNIDGTISVLRNIKSIDIQKSAVGVNQEMVKDSIEISLKSYLTSIKSYQLQIDLLKESIELGQQNIENLELKNSLGMESDYNLKVAKINQETNESNLKTLELTLENQKQALKTLLGIPAEQDIVVDSDVAFNALDDINLESYIVKKVQADPSIILLKNNVEIAKYNKRTNNISISDSDLKIDNDLKSADRALKDGQDAMEKNIRTAYNNIKQLEEQDKSLRLNIEKAKEDYNAVVVRYQAGMATIYEVNQAKLGILNAEKAVEDNALNYDTLVFSFMHPYLLGSN